MPGTVVGGGGDGYGSGSGRDDDGMVLAVKGVVVLVVEAALRMVVSIVTEDRRNDCFLQMHSER